MVRTGSLYEVGYTIAGRYTLLRPLGQGGMGSVWVARDQTLNIEVALKVVRSDYADAKAGARLLREARAAALLRHPAVVRVFDFGTSGGGDPFIVMELLKGESARARLTRQGPLGAVRALHMLLPIVDGLDAAHAAGVVHRDLKPDNLVLAHDERGRPQPKVVDFGLAKLSQTSSSAKLTRTGLLVGTPAYMAPEQIRSNAEVGARTDVWALAVSLYEIIAGQHPFVGADYHTVLQAIVKQPPASLAGKYGVDDALWALLEKGLCKDLSGRWPSMRAFGEALAGWLIGQGVSEDACGASLHAVWLEPKGPEGVGRPGPRSSRRALRAAARLQGAEASPDAAARGRGGAGSLRQRLPMGDHMSLSFEAKNGGGRVGRLTVASAALGLLGLLGVAALRAGEHGPKPDVAPGVRAASPVEAVETPAAPSPSAEAVAAPSRPAEASPEATGTATEAPPVGADAAASASPAQARTPRAKPTSPTKPGSWGRGGRVWF